jgi:hypothetical protein
MLIRCWLEPLRLCREISRLHIGDLKREILSKKYRKYRRDIIRDLRKFPNIFGALGSGVEESVDRQNILIISSYSTIIGIKLEVVMSFAACLSNYSPVVVEASRNPWIRRYHRAAGNSAFVNFYSLVGSTAGDLFGHASVAEFVAALSEAKTIKEIVNLSVGGLDAGRIVLSNIIERHKFETVDPRDNALKTELLEEAKAVFRNLSMAHRLLDRVRPETALVLEKGLSPGAEIVAVCHQRGIPVVQYAGAPKTDELILKRYTFENRHVSASSLSTESWANVRAMPFDANREQELMDEFDEGYRLGTWFRRKHLHSDKKIIPAEDVKAVLSLEPGRKVAVVFSHVLWDATFFYGENLFDDYESWLMETIGYALKNPNVTWLIKLHPDLKWKLRLAGSASELRELRLVSERFGALPEHIRFILPDTSISTRSIFDIADYCLTVRGTVGIEMACRGVPVITAGSGRYAGLGFTSDPKSKSEYRDIIAGIQDLPAMTDREVETARRYAYMLFMRRSFPLTSYRQTYQTGEDLTHPLAVNLESTLPSGAELAASPDMRMLVPWLSGTQEDFLYEED